VSSTATLVNAAMYQIDRRNHLVSKFFEPRYKLLLGSLRLYLPAGLLGGSLDGTLSLGLFLFHRSPGVDNLLSISCTLLGRALGVCGALRILVGVSDRTSDRRGLIIRNGIAHLSQEFRYPLPAGPLVA